MTWLRALWSRLAVIAIGRKNPETLIERKRKAFAGIPKVYVQTQRGKVTNFAEWRDRYHRTRKTA